MTFCSKCHEINDFCCVVEERGFSGLPQLKDALTLLPSQNRVISKCLPLSQYEQRERERDCFEGLARSGWLEHREQGQEGQEKRLGQEEGIPSRGNHGLQVRGLDFIPQMRGRCWGFKLVSTVTRLALLQTHCDCIE